MESQPSLTIAPTVENPGPNKHLHEPPPDQSLRRSSKGADPSLDERLCDHFQENVSVTFPFPLMSPMSMSNLLIDIQCHLTQLPLNLGTLQK